MSEKSLAARLEQELDDAVGLAVEAYQSRREAEGAAQEAKDKHLALLDKAVNLRRAALSLSGTVPDTTAMEALHVNRWVDARANTLTQGLSSAGAWPR